MDKISTVQLGDLIEFQRGYDLPKSEFKSGTVPVISSNGILGYHNEVKVKAPGITIGRSGTVGIPHYITTDFFPHNTSLFVKNFKGNNTKYIFYLLKNLKLNDRKSGSGVPTMNRNHLHPLKIKAYTNTIDQQKIASVLSSLDKKIELNNKINKELEAMAKTLYDYWLTQFDFPDVNGKPYKSSGGKMVYNEELKREIPEGWDVKELKTLIKIERGISYKSTDISDNIGSPMINLNSFYLDGSYKPKGIKYFNNTYSKNKVVNAGDLIIATTDVTRNAYIIGKAVIIPDIYQNDILLSCDIAKVVYDNSLDKYFLEKLFNSDFYHEYIKGFANGTLVLHLNTDGIGWYKTFIPARDLLEKFSRLMKPIQKKKELVTLENEELSKLRDWLLPMLMNGQVKVK